MRLSKKAEYALKALVALARCPANTSMLIEEISSLEKIPVKFLEQILLVLKRSEILRSKRGQGGGYQLNRRAVDITLGEVIALIDGPVEPMSCNLSNPAQFSRSICPTCGLPGGCGLGKVFTELQIQMNAFLQGTSIQDVLAKETKPGDLSFEI
jgi:Rrf2 family transcriptional regulator, iron-sulfur cluster assembly transcription factor